MVINKDTVFYSEKTLPGIMHIANYVKKDFDNIFGKLPNDVNSIENKSTVVYGIVGESEILDYFIERHNLDFTKVIEKREVYQILQTTIEEREYLIIAGSDKRGTIYGLFQLSELLGVSPFVNWNGIIPQKRAEIEIKDQYCYISKEPSVKYRGFFINDEWPAFGTWAMKHFGGINAKCYERVFELLLRLKGNYLWPAMWNSNFEIDGPGLDSAKLADELGIVMSMSHHEPCMRSGGEYGLLRGKNSVYGDAWDFNKNEDGITQFWRDGLIRSKNFEQVITMGMRGENDTAIMGHASMEDNIKYLRKVIKKQNELIKETINQNLDEVPRQIVLFTEVEEFFYGNSKCKGLLGDPELDGVTLMFSDNNFGSTRTLPAKEIRNHKGGFGMYYHQDMHGGPHSYQWIGSTYLPKLQLQMTAAYEYGVKDIWVTNIGDIATQEYGLSYFLDLAYDFDKYKLQGEVDTIQYTKQWVSNIWREKFSKSDLKKICDVILDYTFLLGRQKHEVMNEKVYHPVHYGEAEEVLQICNRIQRKCEELRNVCKKEDLTGFISLIYYPSMATANLMKMWIITGRNELYAQQNRVQTNTLADQIIDCMKFDEKLCNEYMTIDNGKFDGFALGEHVGFQNWNDENNHYPTRRYIEPVKQTRMIVAKTNTVEYSTGEPWTSKELVWKDSCAVGINYIDFDIALVGGSSIDYTVSTDCEWLSFSKKSGHITSTERLSVYVDKSMLSEMAEGRFTVKNQTGATVKVLVISKPDVNIQSGIFVEEENVISIEAPHYSTCHQDDDSKILTIEPYGRTRGAIVAYPFTTDFTNSSKRPYVEYYLHSKEGGKYTCHFYLEATTPVIFKSEQFIGFSVNEENFHMVNTVIDEEHPFFLSKQWQQEAVKSIRITSVKVELQKGHNRFRFYGMSPMIILEKIVFVREGYILPESFLGPKESYFA